MSGLRCTRAGEQAEPHQRALGMGRGCQLSQAAGQAQGEGSPGKLLELQVRSDRRDGAAWSFGERVEAPSHIAAAPSVSALSLPGISSGAALWKVPSAPWKVRVGWGGVGGGVARSREEQARVFEAPVTRASAPAHPVAFPCLPPPTTTTMWPAGAGPTTLAAFTKQQTLMEHRKEGGERREQDRPSPLSFPPAKPGQCPEATLSPHLTGLRQEDRISVASCPARLQCNGHQEPHRRCIV